MLNKGKTRVFVSWDVTGQAECWPHLHTLFTHTVFPLAVCCMVTDTDCSHIGEIPEIQLENRFH